MSDGGTVRGRGRLTDAVIDNFHYYYGPAMRSNKNSLHKIKDTISAIYYHYILCENKPLSQYYLCPKGSASWCHYQREQVERTTIYYSPDKCLPPVFRNELKPSFTRLFDTKLLHRCLKGLTQNANEADNRNNLHLYLKCHSSTGVFQTFC